MKYDYMACAQFCIPAIRHVRRNQPIANLSAANTGELLAFRRVYCNLDGVRRLHDVPGFFHFVRRAMSHKKELVRFERQLVFHDAVFGDANTVQPRTQRA